MQKKIYTITTIFEKDGRIESSRTPAWYHSIKAAEEAVLSNTGDMFEYYYNFAVIEETPEGMYGTSEPGAGRWFYEWDDSIRAYKECEAVPKWAENIFGFGLG